MSPHSAPHEVALLAMFPHPARHEVASLAMSPHHLAQHPVTTRGPPLSTRRNPADTHKRAQLGRQPEASQQHPHSSTPLCGPGRERRRVAPRGFGGGSHPRRTNRHPTTRTLGATPPCAKRSDAVRSRPARRRRQRGPGRVNSTSRSTRRHPRPTCEHPQEPGGHAQAGAARAAARSEPALSAREHATLWTRQGTAPSGAAGVWGRQPPKKNKSPPSQPQPWVLRRRARSARTQSEVARPAAVVSTAHL